MFKFKITKIKIFAALLFIAFSWVAAHLIVINSAAPAAAEEFIRSHPLIVMKVGVIKRVRVAWWGNSVTTEANAGSAILHMHIIGDKASANTDLNLTRENKVWRVIGGKLSVNNEESKLF